jgi:hypothetical protein
MFSLFTAPIMAVLTSDEQTAVRWRFGSHYVGPGVYVRRNDTKTRVDAWKGSHSSSVIVLLRSKMQGVICFRVQEESLIKTASAASLSTGKTNAELMVTRRRGRWQSLASIDSNPSAASLGKLAVDEAAAHPGGLQHLDDYYVPITPGNKKTINAAGNSEVDKKIPVRAIESAVYPLIGGFSEMPESGQSATEAFGEHLRANGLSDKVILFSKI